MKAVIPSKWLNGPSTRETDCLNWFLGCQSLVLKSRQIFNLDFFNITSSDFVHFLMFSDDFLFSLEEQRQGYDMKSF